MLETAIRNSIQHSWFSVETYLLILADTTQMKTIAMNCTKNTRITILQHSDIYRGNAKVKTIIFINGIGNRVPGV